MVEILRTIGMIDASSRFPDLCQQVAESGEAVLIARRGEPWVEVRPARRPTGVERGAGSPRGILDFRRECEVRFGPLEDELELF